MLSPSRLAAVVLPPLLAAVVAAGQDRPSLTPEAWLKAVEAHEPGEADRVAMDVGRASSRDLLLVLEAVTKLAKHGAMNATLERGAWLHADIAMLVSGADGPPIDRRRRGVYLVEDGRGLGVGAGSRHIEFGRALLGAIRPSPAESEAARRWYRAVSAELLGRSLLADAEVHLGEARQLFKREAWLAFDLGCLHEVWAAPEIQQIVGSWTALPKDYPIADQETQLKRAERYFKEALDLDPGLLEARLRLGRVIGLGGRHSAAVGELERVAGAGLEPVLAYYAHMFLGREYEAVSRPDLAREQYERAAARYPRAQSPHLALSRLARVRGDAAAALDAVHRILELPSGEHEREDPWWVYHLGRGRDADAILGEARRVAVGGGR